MTDSSALYRGRGHGTGQRPDGAPSSGTPRFHGNGASPAQATTTRARRSAPAARWSSEDAPTIERWFERALLFLLVGYLLFDRAFAWLHVPGTPAFVGEMVLGLGVLYLLTTRTRIESLRQSTPLVFVAVFILWGVWRALPGFTEYGVDALRDAAFFYQSAFAILIAMLLTGRLERLWHWLERYRAIIPGMVVWFVVAIVLGEVFGERPPFVPDSQVSVFSHKIGSIANHSMLALLYIWLVVRDRGVGADRRRLLLTTAVVAIVGVCGVVNRGSFMGVAVGMLVLWLLDRRRTGAVVGRAILIGLALMAVALVFDLRVSFFDNNREVSVQQLAANFESIIDPSSADSGLSGTADWRVQYWQRLISDVRQQQLFRGLGFGVNLRVQYGEQDEEPPARDAHNSHVNIFARGGLGGFTLWVLVWGVWFAHLLAARRLARRPGGDPRIVNLATVLIAAQVMILVNAFFDPTLEGPQVGVWAWALYGIGAVLPVSNRGRRGAAASRRAVDDARSLAGAGSSG